jgi:hypothetical protein
MAKKELYFRQEPMDEKGRILGIIQTDIVPEMGKECDPWYDGNISLVF